MTALAHPSRKRRLARAYAWTLAGTFTRRRARLASAVVTLAILPVAVAAFGHVRYVRAWDDAAGDVATVSALLAQREAAFSLAEAAAHLQAGTGLAYRWTEAPEGAAGYVETSNGYLPLAVRRFGEGSVGVVRNELGAVVVHVGGLTGARCRSVADGFGEYPKVRASAAYLERPPAPEALPDVVRRVEWLPFAEAVARCEVTGERLGTLLLRMDGKTGRS